MTSSAPSSESVTLRLADEAATEHLAGRVAELAQPGDVIALEGELGVGKTRFARAFIGRLAGEQEVPSPTFTLVQIYDSPVAPIWHFDLYRLADPDEAFELGIEEAFGGGISLIEWPERLGPHLPEERLDIGLAFAEEGPEARTASLTGRGRWAPRVALLANHA